MNKLAKIKRLYRLPSLFGSPDVVDLPPNFDVRFKFDAPLVDDSYYVPSSEAVKTVDRLKTNSSVQGVYDFPNGRDTGSSAMLVRKRGLDVTEVAAIADVLRDTAETSLERDLKTSSDDGVVLSDVLPSDPQPSKKAVKKSASKAVAVSPSLDSPPATSEDGPF